MRFWIREIAGWLLVAAGLYFCLASISIVTANPSAVFGAIHVTVIGITVFRGGIHLLKVAMAARAAIASQLNVEPSGPLPVARSAPVRAAPEEW